MCISEKDATQIIKNINVYLDDYFFFCGSQHVSGTLII